MRHPLLLQVQRKFHSPCVSDVPSAVQTEWEKLLVKDRVQPGERVAIAVGSRGITAIQEVIRVLGGILRGLGAAPFVVPAMGSHGGATADGQAEVLRGLGITEASIGMPICSSMEVERIGSIAEGYPLYFDRHAWQADHIVVVNRIKPHTDFAGKVESGLMKMMVIGLGNHQGAQIAHAAFSGLGFERALQAAASAIMHSGKIICGLAILENHVHQTAHIEALASEQIFTREPELLNLARQWMPGLPVKQIDLLVVDEIGKEISGTGMDTNVVGRKHLIHGIFAPDAPLIQRIYVRDLTMRSYGNATGIGLADYTHKRLVDKTVLQSTYQNCSAANNPRAAAIPMYFSSDREALAVALQSTGVVDPARARVVWIKNTLDLDTLWISTALRREVEGCADAHVQGGEYRLQFDDAGNCAGFVSATTSSS